MHLLSELRTISADESTLARTQLVQTIVNASFRYETFLAHRKLGFADELAMLFGTTVVPAALLVMSAPRSYKTIIPS